MSHRKLLSLLLAIVVLFSLTGCAGETEDIDEIVVPPVRFGNSSASVWCPNSFDAIVNEVDAVVHARVGNWLGDNDDGWTTSYEAEALAVYKGDVPENFVLIQDGKGGDGDHVAFAVAGYPLFTYGNELFLFLKKVDNEDYGIEYHENSYYICGSHLSVFYVSQDSSGASYAVPSFSNHLYSGENAAGQMIAEPGGTTIGAEVSQALADNDPEVWSNSVVTRAYPLNDLAERVQNAASAAASISRELS